MTPVTRTKLTPPDVARLWGVDANKILGWIKRGELRAIDVSARLGGRPRYRIDIRDLEEFERRRSVSTPVTIPRRRRKAQPGVIEFF